MGLLDGLVVKIGSDTAGLEAGVAGAKAMLASLSNNPLAAVGLGLGVAAVAAVGFGAASVKMAGDFQQSITKLYTSAGESKSNLQMVADGILAMSVTTATSTKELADGMYMVESAGYHGAAGLDVLKAAAMGAKAENAPLAEVANAVTSALNAYSLKSTDAAMVTNTLVAAVGAGKMRMADLATALSNVLPVSATFGISLTDTTAAIATMTMQGDDASSAATHLRQMLLALEAPATAGAKALASIGLSSAQVSAEMKVSLPGAVQMITDALSKTFPKGSSEYNQAIKNIAGGSKQMLAILELSGSHLQTFKDNVVQITGAVKQGGNSILGWSDIQGNFNFQMEAAKNAVEALMIKVGTALLPVLTSLVSQIVPLITNFTNWLISSGALTTGLDLVVGAVTGLVTGISNVVTVGVGIVSFFKNSQVAALALLIPLGILGGYFTYLGVTALVAFIAAASAMIASFIAGAAAAWTMAAGVIAATWPFLLIGAAIGLVVALVILAITHWGQITEFLKTVWGAIAGFFVGLWGQITTDLQGFVDWLGGVWNGLMSFLGNAVKTGMQVVYLLFFGPILAVEALFNWLYNHNYYFKDLVDTITNVVKAGLAWLQNAWQGFVDWVTGLWNTNVLVATAMWNAMSGAIMSVVNTVVTWLTNIWNGVVKAIQLQWNLLAGFATTAWNAVSGVISSAWNTYIAGPLGGIWTNFINWFDNLAAQFYTSGSNFIQMLVNGILSMNGVIWNAVVSIAKTIWTALGFHSPAKAGPASDADKWMPNFVNMMTQGLNAGVPKMQTAAVQLAQPLTVLSPAASVGIGASSSGAGVSSGGASGTGQTFILEVDGRQLAQITNTHTDRLVRMKLGTKGIQAA